MQYVSTRGAGPVTLDEALVAGIADDGGLFVPTTLPEFSVPDFDGADSLIDVARVFFEPFFEGSTLAADIDGVLADTYSFPIPRTKLPGGDWSLLELYHGPTAAFKDVGAGFLAACLGRLEGDVSAPLTILVATSGDTGGAVAAALSLSQQLEDAVIVAIICDRGDRYLSTGVFPD